MFSQAHPNILMFNFAKLCSTEEVTKVPRNRKQGWQRTEDEHLESPPADLTLPASGQAANATKRKSGAGFQERELLPTPGCGNQLLPSASGLHEERHHQNSPLAIAYLFACSILKMTRFLIFLVNVGMSDQISYCF